MSGPSLQFVSRTGTSIDLASAPYRLSAIEGAGVAEPRDQVELVPQRDGVVVVRTELAERYIRVGVTIAGATVAARYDARRALGAALNPRAGLGLLRYQPHAAAPTYEIPAKYESGAGFGNDQHGPMLERVTIAFRCPDPAWRVTPQVAASLDVAASGLSFPLAFPLMFPSSPADYVVNNAGDLDSYPVLTLVAGAAGAVGARFQNLTTGEDFALRRGSALSLVEDDALVVDMGEKTAVKYPAAGGDPVSVMGFRTAESQMWALRPGSNTVRISLDLGEADTTVAYWQRLAGV